MLWQSVRKHLKKSRSTQWNPSMILFHSSRSSTSPFGEKHFLDSLRQCLFIFSVWLERPSNREINSYLLQQMVLTLSRCWVSRWPLQRWHLAAFLPRWVVSGRADKAVQDSALGFTRFLAGSNTSRTILFKHYFVPYWQNESSTPSR